jgi:ribonuclease BN (tRNA processing enzyme)
LKAVLLGSSAVCTAERDYTSLVIEGKHGIVLLDCGGNPVRNILRAGMNPEDLHTILITHHHTDHICGLPIIGHEMMLRGAAEPLEVFCPSQGETKLRSIVDSYFRDEPKIPKIEIRPIPSSEEATFAETDEWAISSTPVDHYGITVAYKVVDGDGRALVYAPDTRPCEGLGRFAKGVDVLLHDCTYPEGFEREAHESHHSTALQAGKVASLAGVKKLVLIHLGANCVGRSSELLHSAEKEFAGWVVPGRDFMTV